MTSQAGEHSQIPNQSLDQSCLYGSCDEICKQKRVDWTDIEECAVEARLRSQGISPPDTQESNTSGNDYLTKNYTTRHVRVSREYADHDGVFIFVVQLSIDS